MDIPWCVSSSPDLAFALNAGPLQYVIDEVDEGLANLEAALSNDVFPGKRRRRLSLLVIVSALVLNTDSV